MGQEVTFKVKYNTEEQPIGIFGDGQAAFDPQERYKVVSSKDQRVCNVDFKAGEIAVMTGLLAKACIRQGHGSIQLYSEKAQKAAEEKEDLESLKQQVAELKAARSKMTTSEDIPGPEKKPKSKKSKKSSD